ncbi:hypothetical protein C8Q70DRAFT_169677 [Cubamyces menziesii]|nr:hypothetical protein C8Q70DRAFT_169677 [Cubamyces menziesii]
MFDGGHVRRRPVSSFAEVAFCVQVEGNNCTTLSGRVPPLASAKKPPQQVSVNGGVQPSIAAVRECAHILSSARLLPLQGRVQVNAPPVLLVHRLRHSLHPMCGSQASSHLGYLNTIPTNTTQPTRGVARLAPMVWSPCAALSSLTYHARRCTRRSRRTPQAHRCLSTRLR